MAGEKGCDKWRGFVKVPLRTVAVLKERFGIEGETPNQVMARVLNEIADKYEPSAEATKWIAAKVKENFEARMASRTTARILKSSVKKQGAK